MVAGVDFGSCSTELTGEVLLHADAGAREADDNLLRNGVVMRSSSRIPICELIYYRLLNLLLAVVALPCLGNDLIASVGIFIEVLLEEVVVSVQIILIKLLAKRG